MKKLNLVLLALLLFSFGVTGFSQSSEIHKKEYRSRLDPFEDEEEDDDDDLDEVKVQQEEYFRLMNSSNNPMDRARITAIYERFLTAVREE